MKTPAQFAAWVNGIRRLYYLFELVHGQPPTSAGETLSWIQKQWRQFIADKHPLCSRYVRYCNNHRLEEGFFEWIESKALLKEALIESHSQDHSPVRVLALPHPPEKSSRKSEIMFDTLSVS